jgi:hypothetical protein
LTYRGGQRPIVHLEADLHAAVEWAEANGKRWSFSNGNAGARYTRFFDDLDELGILEWDAIGATLWRDFLVRDRKQAEFLLEESFPWELIERIGVIDDDMAQQVVAALRDAEHKPPVVVARNWYY